MKAIYSKLSAFLAVLVAAMLPSLAHAVATPIPSADVLLQLAEINVFVLAVGVVMISAAAIAVAIKWGKATIFG
jgi:hypothetical protein